MKSAQQKMNEFFAESDATRKVMRQFSDAAHKNYGSYAYVAGYLESQVVSLIMELPKKRREAVREEIVRMAERQEKEHLLNTLKETA
jgi:hypothetical protein